MPEGTQLIWRTAVSIDAVLQVAPQLPRPMVIGLRPGYCLGSMSLWNGSPKRVFFTDDSLFFHTSPMPGVAKS